jgi:hypothetical protein
MGSATSVSGSDAPAAWACTRAAPTQSAKLHTHIRMALTRHSLGGRLALGPRLIRPACSWGDEGLVRQAGTPGIDARTLLPRLHDHASVCDPEGQVKVASWADGSHDGDPGIGLADPVDRELRDRHPPEAPSWLSSHVCTALRCSRWGDASRPGTAAACDHWSGSHRYTTRRTRSPRRPFGRRCRGLRPSRGRD